MDFYAYCIELTESQPEQESEEHRLEQCDLKGFESIMADWEEKER